MLTLTTERLTLRPFRADDFAGYRDFYASARARHIGGPYDSATAWRSFAADIGHWTLKGFGWLIIDDGQGARGIVGLHHPPHHADLELGWSLWGEATGKGYATEAARALRAWGLATLRPERLVSYIHTDNTGSKAVAARLGAAPEAGRAAHDPACEVWRHPL